MFKSLIFWIAFPFVIPQALKVRKNAPRFTDAEGGEIGIVGTGHSIKVLGVGDSIIAGVGTSNVSKSWLGQTCYYLSEQLNAQIQWTRIAESGANLAKINLNTIDQLKEGRFDFIIISVGVNDVTGLSGLRKWAGQLHEMLRYLKSHSPDSIIVLSGVPPMHVFPLLPQPLRYLLGLRAKSFDEVIRQVIKSYYKVIHLPIEIDPDPKNFSDDGFHPSEYGCQKWGEATAESIIVENEN